MGKSEYFEVRKVEGEVEQPQIILDAEAIYDLLLRAELMMTKVDRMRYANRAIEQILDVIREFMLAYDFEDDRKLHLERMSANIAVFLRTRKSLRSGSPSATITMIEGASRPTKAISTMIFSYANTDSSLTS